MATLPSKLLPVLERLLAQSVDSCRVTLDEIGDAIDLVPVSTDDADALIDALERAGRTVVGPEGARGAENLRRVLPAARALGARLGRPPVIEEIARETGLSDEDVRHALALGRVMGR